jgi:hypothetical protein
VILSSKLQASNMSLWLSPFLYGIPYKTSELYVWDMIGNVTVTYHSNQSQTNDGMIVLLIFDDSHKDLGYSGYYRFWRFHGVYLLNSGDTV